MIYFISQVKSYNTDADSTIIMPAKKRKREEDSESAPGHSDTVTPDASVADEGLCPRIVVFVV